MTEVLNTGLLPESSVLYETVAVVITGIFAILGMYVRKFLQTNSKAVEYNLYNERTERILADALAYAETAANGLAKSKLDKKYIDITNEVKQELLKNSVSLSQIYSYQKSYENFMLALKSRLIKKMNERAKKEFITSVFGYFFTKALYDSEEKSLALKARGFFDQN